MTAFEIVMVTLTALDVVIALVMAISQSHK